MKLHFDGTTNYLGAGTVGWAQFSCQFTYDEVTLLEAYLCGKLTPYHLTACFRVIGADLKPGGTGTIIDLPEKYKTEEVPGRYAGHLYEGERPWYLDLPEKDAMEFRLRFPCSHIPTEILRKGNRKVFDEHSLDFVLEF